MADTLNSEPYYYNSRYSGAEVDEAVGRALGGGALDVTDAALNAQINANTNLLHAVSAQVLNNDGSSKITPISEAASQAETNASAALAMAQTATARINDSTTGLAAIWAALNNVGTVYNAGSYEGDGNAIKTIVSSIKMTAVACFISIETENSSAAQAYLLAPIIAGSFYTHALYVSPAGEITIYHPSSSITMVLDESGYPTGYSQVVINGSGLSGVGPFAAMNVRGTTYNYVMIGAGLGS